MKIRIIKKIISQIVKLKKVKMSSTKAKKAAGEAALQFVQQDMLLGLGTGSTVAFFLDALAEQCRQGLRVVAVTTSEKTERRAKELGISLADIDTMMSLDLTVDGADEIDGQKRMIKGGGGALLREKIVASMSKEMIVIVDSSKAVTKLGKFPLPVEILPFAYRSTLHKIKQLGYQGSLRANPDESVYVTDNNNYIFDIHFPHFCDDPEKVNQELQEIPGVMATGFFFNLAGRVIVGNEDGKYEIRT